MSKDLSKVKAGDFVKDADGRYGIVITMSDNTLVIVSETGYQTFTSESYKFCSWYYEFKRIPKPMNYHYGLTKWKESFEEIAEPVFKSEPTIEIELYINGKIANLSDISEETLIKLRKEN